MDPKQNTSNPPLDPKLKETYDRVMGISLSDSPQAPADPTQPAPTIPFPVDSPIPVSPVSNPVPITPPAMDPVVIPTPADPPTPIPSVPPEPAAPPVPSVGDPVAITPSIADPMSTPQPSIPIPPQNAPMQHTDPTATSPSPAMESLHASAVLPHADHMNADVITIGTGGSPVASGVKAKHKGISPVILIFAGIAFLAVYGVFWVKFFNYSLPFLPK